MSHRYLLDTNIISDLIRNPQGRIYQQILNIGEDNICTSIIVACELRFGALKKASAPLIERVEQIVTNIEVLPLEQPVDHHYGSIRNFLESKGQIIGPNDLLIAAHAIALDAVLVTANEKEFERVPQLKLQNWLE